MHRVQWLQIKVENMPLFRCYSLKCFWPHNLQIDDRNHKVSLQWCQLWHNVLMQFVFIWIKQVEWNGHALMKVKRFNSIRIGAGVQASKQLREPLVSVTRYTNVHKGVNLEQAHSSNSYVFSKNHAAPYKTEVFPGSLYCHSLTSIRSVICN